MYVIRVVSSVTQRIGLATYQQRNIERCLLVMGFVMDVVRGYYPVINDDSQTGVGGIAALMPKRVYNGIPKYHRQRDSGEITLPGAHVALPHLCISGDFDSFAIKGAAYAVSS